MHFTGIVADRKHASTYLLGPNKHGLVTYIQVNAYIDILEIRCRGSTVAELPKLVYVPD